MESALVIVLGDAEPFEAIRRDVSGVPFHITLLYPFAPTDELTAALLEDVRGYFRQRAPFELELTCIATWPDVVYVVPEPEALLRELMSGLFARYPQWPPYGGIHDEVIPHATLAEEVDAAAVFGDIERRAAPHLPKRYLVDEATLLEEYAPHRWRESERFPLGGQGA